MMHALPYLIGFIVPLTVLVAAQFGGILRVSDAAGVLRFDAHSR